VFIASTIRVIISVRASENGLGGVVISVLATGSKRCWFEPGQGDGFLKSHWIFKYYM
jgi:hypothetical protein